jgi:geranylgeranyl diphosphate synthase type I
MVVQSPLKRIFTRYASLLQQALQTEVTHPETNTPSLSLQNDELKGFYGQISYHMGWVDQTFAPVQHATGKLLRPTLLLLAYEAVGAQGSGGDSEGTTHLQRALPAACAIELFHNFTLMHDDIEDGDRERRHRPTAWTVFGIPQAVNTGDGISCLSRLALLKSLEAGVHPAQVARLCYCFDRTSLAVIEGQYLDLSFESREEVTISMYLEMITRKTAKLISCAAELGGMLGTDDLDAITWLRQYGLYLGIAFQMRDDMLGIWATQEESGKAPAGDLLRRKKTLPVLHALEHASPQDQASLRAIYRASAEPTEEQIPRMLSILAAAHSREYCQHILKEQCELARNALAHVPVASSPLAQEAAVGLMALISYVEDPSWIA